MKYNDQLKFILFAGWGIWLLVLIAGAGWHAGIRRTEIVHFGVLMLRDMSLLLIFVSSSFGYGAQIVKIVALSNQHKDSIYYLSSVALGLGAMAHLMFVLGALGLLYPIVAWVLVSMGTVMALFELFCGWRELIRVNFSSHFSMFETGLFLLILLNSLYPLLAGALSPPFWWDEAAYHLAVPKIYIRHHAIVYIPFIPYSNWPMEAEMLFTIGLLLCSESLPHLIEWISFLFTSYSLYLFGKRFFSPTTGWLSAAVFSATPMTLTLAGTGLIESTLTLYISLATFFLLQWIQSNKKDYLVLSALFGGLSASVKLNGAIITLILGMITLLFTMMHVRSIKIALKNFTIFGFLSFTVVLPWYIKNWWHTGNPFWPFLLDVLGGRYWDPLGTEYLLGFIQKPNLPITFANWLLGLWHQTFHPIGPPQIALGPLYLALFPLSIMTLLLRSHSANWSPIYWWLFVITLLYYTAWFFQTHQTRFLMPVTPLMALLSAAGIEWFTEELSVCWKLLSNLIRIGLLLCLLTFSWITNPDARSELHQHWQFLSGRLTRDEFLLARVSGYETFLYANQHLPEDAYVLLALYESRGYYLDREYMWANPISQRVLRLEQVVSAHDLADQLKTLGVTHILFRPVGLEKFTYIRHGEYIVWLMKTFLREYTRLIYATPELELYELATPSTGN